MYPFGEFGTRDDNRISFAMILGEERFARHIFLSRSDDVLKRNAITDVMIVHPMDIGFGKLGPMINAPIL